MIKIILFLVFQIILKRRRLEKELTINFFYLCYTGQVDLETTTVGDTAEVGDNTDAANAGKNGYSHNNNKKTF